MLSCSGLPVCFNTSSSPCLWFLSCHHLSVPVLSLPVAPLPQVPLPHCILSVSQSVVCPSPWCYWTLCPVKTPWAISDHCGSDSGDQCDWFPWNEGPAESLGPTTANRFRNAAGSAELLVPVHLHLFSTVQTTRWTMCALSIYYISAHVRKPPCSWASQKYWLTKHPLVVVLGIIASCYSHKDVCILFINISKLYAMHTHPFVECWRETFPKASYE